MSENLYFKNTLVNKIPIHFNKSDILSKNELIETFTAKQKAITYDFDIERVTTKKKKFFPENKRPYLAADLKEIAKKLGCDKSLTKKQDLIDCINKEFYKT